jgi:hemoglobin-like flavoprotein
MTLKQIQLIKETFRVVAPSADAVAATFYARLFELDPSLRAMFPSSLEEQGRKLMQVLGAAVGMLDRPETLIPVLESLGRRHVGYGVRDEHYDTVGAALLWTLGQGLGPAFITEACDAWAALYQLVATTMQNAARTEPPRLEPAMAV